MSQDTAFKNWINSEVVKTISNEIKKHYPAFDDKSFNQVGRQLAPLELRARAILISNEMKKYLPDDFTITAPLLLKVLKKGSLHGFQLWAFSEYIATYGISHLKQSLELMTEMTLHFSSEFAVRPFIQNYPSETLKYLLGLTSNKSVDLRRWASEGSRPLLPWGMKLAYMVENPNQSIKILEKLRYDDELYVRKSVSNHLNDISKFNPELVLSTLKQWEKQSPEKHLVKIQWIKKQALRTLIKKGHPSALKMMGVNTKTALVVSPLKLKTRLLKLGDHLHFECKIKSTDGKKNQKLVIDYVVHFKKSNGKTNGKVFKLTVVDLKPHQEIVVQKRHHLKKITTMRFYPGEHFVSLKINGQETRTHAWDFKV